MYRAHAALTGTSSRLMLVAILGLLVATMQSSQAQTYSILYNFAPGADGAVPAAPVTLDATTGNLYGATLIGGTGTACYRGCGTVFELTSTGVETVLYSFTGLDGTEPMDVFLDAQRNLFGTTSGGGAYGYGTVFEIDPNGVETVLHSFAGGTDGEAPTSGLIQDPNTGDFYGVTCCGGTYSWGTLYKITATGIHTVLYSFGGPGTVGINPAGKLAQDGRTGNLYGMLICGGTGCGAVFQFPPAGVETALHVFTGPDGCQTGSFDPGLVMECGGESVRNDFLRRRW